MNEKLSVDKHDQNKSKQLVGGISKRWLFRLNQSFVNDFEYNDDKVEFQLEKINQAFLLNFNYFPNQTKYELLIGPDYDKKVYFLGKIISHVIDYDEITIIDSEKPNLINGIWPYLEFSIVTKKTKQIIKQESKLWL